MEAGAGGAGGSRAQVGQVEAGRRWRQVEAGRRWGRLVRQPVW